MILILEFLNDTLTHLTFRSAGILVNNGNAPFKKNFFFILNLGSHYAKLQLASLSGLGPKLLLFKLINGLN